jgi:hypothetical protein
VFAFGVVAAADQVGVASTLINTLFIGLVAALALAFGLAFGLGGREEAGSILRDWRGHATRAMSPANPAMAGNGTTAAAREADAEEMRRRDELMRLS